MINDTAKMAITWNKILTDAGNADMIGKYRHSLDSMDDLLDLTMADQWRRLFRTDNIDIIIEAYGAEFESMSDKIMDSLSEYLSMMDVFYSCGRVMLPTESGPQCGEAEFTLALGKALLKVSEERISDKNN